MAEGDRDLDLQRPFPQRPSPYGESGATDRLGGVAAPLLAGFGITTIGLIQQVNTVRWPDLAILILVAATVSLLMATQWTFRAVRFSVTPSDAIQWYPDFHENAERQSRVREEMGAHRIAYRAWTQRSRAAFGLGIVLLLAGLGVSIVPEGNLTPVRSAAVAVFSFAALMETVEVLGEGLFRGVARRPRSWRLARMLWWAYSLDPLTRPVVGQTGRTGANNAKSGR